MQKFLNLTVLMAITWALSFSNLINLEACTGIRLKAKDGVRVNGRTLEFGIKIDIDLVVIPRGYEFVGTTANGPGLKYTSKYASTGAIAFNKNTILDGMNEKGLSVGTFYFPGFAEYAELTSVNQAQSLSQFEFPNWILSQFATIEEVKTALSKVEIVPFVIKEWGSTPAPFHYVVYDKNGDSLAIEPIKGKLVTYDNPLGVFTNSPNFTWHMTNLRNFINLTPFNVNPVELEGVKFTAFGQGSGMVGLPGDFTPPSRFVRAAIFSATATPSDNGDEAVFQAFHILNQFDIPVGAASVKEDGVIHSDYTQFTCVKDPNTLKYYFKSYDDQNIRFVDLKKFDLNSKTVKKASTVSKEKAIDFSSSFSNN